MPGVTVHICRRGANLYRAMICAAIAAWTPHAVASARYTITNLGAFSESSYAYAVNDSGQVVGECMGADGQQSFLYTGGILTPLPIYGANAINNSGQVAGLIQVVAEPHAAIYANGQVVDLGTLGGSYSYAFGMNESGHVVGVAQTSAGNRGFIHKDGATLPLGDETFRAYGLNDTGDAVGLAMLPPGDIQGVLLRSDGSTLLLQDLGGHSNWPRRINNAGQIAGYAKLASGKERAVIWRERQAFELSVEGELFSRAYGLNEREQVVGYSFPTGAMLWEDGLSYPLVDLLPPDHGWGDLYVAYDISDSGHIVGYGSIGGQTRAFLMTPVPEPCTLSMGVILAAVFTLFEGKAVPKGSHSKRSGRHA